MGRPPPVASFDTRRAADGVGNGRACRCGFHKTTQASSGQGDGRRRVARNWPGELTNLLGECRFPLVPDRRLAPARSGAHSRCLKISHDKNDVFSVFSGLSPLVTVRALSSNICVSHFSAEERVRRPGVFGPAVEWPCVFCCLRAAASAFNPCGGRLAVSSRSKEVA